MAPAQHAPPPAKKGKGKKAPDASEQQKQIQAKIAQLELDAAGDKEQELEIGGWRLQMRLDMDTGRAFEYTADFGTTEREVKKANRELSSLLSNMDGPLSRLEVVQKKYTELLADMKRTERDYQKAKKRGDQLQKEKDAQRSELNKVTSIKDKLDKLSRDFAKENKKLKDELQKIETTESAAREDLHRRLEILLADVEDCIAAQNQPEPQNQMDIELDELFRQKFKSFIDQYELRELQFHSLLRTKDLEIQYQMARLEQQRKQQEEESSKSHQLTRQVSTFSQTETELRTQLNIYVEKFKQVEETLNNSNDLFLTFRKEMEEMSKKTKRLEKENQNLTRNKEVTRHNIGEMVEERTKMQDEMARKNKEVEDQRKKIARLETLCRGMQAQGRGQVPMGELEEDDEITESEYDYEDEDDEGSGEYDDDTEEDVMEPVPERRPFGPVPPPPPPPQTLANGKVNGHGQRQANGQVNGVKR
ncbi:myosin-like coiled-coil protein-domain-containing protein [Massariosphaeria phaeospora]|uniref:Myosin-like coiled-coil protein-domain-containing protein n=1 Tax=Massariosphaeria phaeospora TaxID=100035 RepID=A0A7C8ICU4_9PLEO|nr:myosin-like coiled-coil protein-domain-containing protein [Massariosphaeria phaeospora]